MSRQARGVATRAVGTLVALAMVATSARFVAVLAGGGGCRAAVARPAGLKTSYVKREVMIPMRDGVKLFTIVYSAARRVADAIRS